MMGSSSVGVHSSAIANLPTIFAALQEKRLKNKLYRFYPDDDQPGFPARHRYQKHLEFFRAGRNAFARYAMCGNGLGKTEGMGGYELIWHARGVYPHWWEGKQFDRPIDVWVVGKTQKDVRDTLQTKLLGRPYEEINGGGMFPADWVDFKSIKRVSAPAGTIDTFRVRHVSGGYSYVTFKSYEQGLSAFYGAEKDIVWFDEPPPVAIYSQGVQRTRNREGAFVMVTATPIEGRTETVKMFLDEPDPSRVIIRAGWDDVPHLTEEWKQNALANTPIYLRNAVKYGDPTRTGGAVYPIDEKQFVIEPFRIPDHFKWVYGMDCGWHYTACVFYAYDPDRDIMYLVADYKDGGIDKNSGERIDYTIHATRIKSRAKILSGMDDMPGVADASAINQKDGEQMLKLYRSCGLNLHLPDKAVNAGIAAVTERICSGRHKVFNTNVQWLNEFRDYSVDDDGKPIKVNDHEMDASRYAVLSGVKLAKSKSSAQSRVVVGRTGFA